MYDASVPVFLQMLNNLSAILDKAEADAMNRKIDPEVLLNYRLAPDMFPFVRQIQIATDLAKGAAARLAGVEVPKHDDTEKTCADLKARITNTATFVQSIQPGDIDGSESRDITLTLGEHTLSFKGCISCCPTFISTARQRTTSSGIAVLNWVNGISSELSNQGTRSQCQGSNRSSPRSPATGLPRLSHKGG